MKINKQIINAPLSIRVLFFGILLIVGLSFIVPLFIDGNHNATNLRARLLNLGEQYQGQIYFFGHRSVGS